MPIDKIVIISPTDIVSGGVCSLHILCRSLRGNGFDACMMYLKPNEWFLENPIIISFHVPYIEYVEDKSDTLVIVPESLTIIFNQYKKVRKMVYWLGIYFFFKTPPHRFPLNFKLLRSIFKCKIYFGSVKNKYHAIAQKVNYWNKAPSPVWDSNVMHMSNSFYAAEFIKNKGVKQVFVLHNPVRDEFYEYLPKPEREKVILFGPKTRTRVIKYIQKQLSDYLCIRLKSLSPQKTMELYRKSMIFVEMGNFAGRDRMPREAVLSGCVVLISLTGSAAYNNDFNLPDYYKINTNKKYLPLLVKKIKHITSDYLYHYHNMQQFLDDLRIEKDSFNDKVKDIFDKIISDSTKNNDFSV
jgi:hypothetical protein